MNSYQKKVTFPVRVSKIKSATCPNTSPFLSLTSLERSSRVNVAGIEHLKLIQYLGDHRYFYELNLIRWSINLATFRSIASYLELR